MSETERRGKERVSGVGQRGRPPPDLKKGPARNGVRPGEHFFKDKTKTTTFGGESECRWHHRLTRTIDARSD
jgi:hypothetical protein